MTPHQLLYSIETLQTLQELKARPDLLTVRKAVRKALDLMASNLRHPGLKTHPFDSLSGPRGEKVFEAYAQNRTPGAWRIFFYYGPEARELTVLAITPHP